MRQGWRWVGVGQHPAEEEKALAMAGCGSGGGGGEGQHSISDFRNERGRSRAVRADLIWRGGAREGRT